MPTVEQQNAARSTATSASPARCFPDETCTAGAGGVSSPHPTGGAPEVDDQKLGRVTFYTRTLAVPARRDVGDPDDRRGRAAVPPSSAARRATCRRCTPGRPTSPRSPTRRSIPTPTCCCTTWAPASPTIGPTVAASGIGVAHRAAVGHRARRDVNGHTRFLHDGQRPQPGRGDPLARRRGRTGQAASSARSPRVADREALIALSSPVSIQDSPRRTRRRRRIAPADRRLGRRSSSPCVGRPAGRRRRQRPSELTSSARHRFSASPSCSRPRRRRLAAWWPSRRAACSRPASSAARAAVRSHV